jgi:conjugative relaxase-like TrwC/TraI family protein
MLRITQSTNSASAQSYYSTADYYAEGQELVGVWGGRGAQRLGLFGTVGKAQWDALCENTLPFSGRPLTARTKEPRTVGYDFSFHVPKSVSVLYGLTRDERILDAFRATVRETMADMEREMQTRVRSGRSQTDRTTGNLVWGEYTHFTARPVRGVPDPQLHAHCFVFNATFDDTEGRWKAGQFRDLKRDAPFFEAVFHANLARRLMDLGLPVDRTDTGWEVRGIDETTRTKFSRRTAQIEDKAKELGITDPELKSELGSKTREKKNTALGLPELEQHWRSRLSPEELHALESLQAKVGTAPVPDDAEARREAVERAIEHGFERRSVLDQRRLQADALKRGVGAGSAGSILRELERVPLITSRRDSTRVLVTSREVLAEEQRMLAFARKGRGTLAPIHARPAEHVFTDQRLNVQQRRAVLHVLGSRDRVTLVRGAAGVGKTTMMAEAARAIEAQGLSVHTFAPSADASRVTLCKEGFADADTVARLLVDDKLQESLRDQVLWIDEAGLIGTKTMGRTFDVAQRVNARVVLSGDRYQHGPVERGAALRLLEEEAGIRPAEIKEIQRQKGLYREAVDALAKGDIATGFGTLDRLGWIQEVPDKERYKLLARDYIETVQAGKTALVVSPTHAEGDRITREIRRELVRSGRLAKNNRTVRVLTPTNRTLADKSDLATYHAGEVLSFTQNAKGHRRGQRLSVTDPTKIPVQHACQFEVYAQKDLELAKGDLIRITRGGKDLSGTHKLENGSVYTVKGFDRAGHITLTNGWTISKDFGHLTHGYVTTSHSSQGRSVDRVFIGQAERSFPASSTAQFYVSVSRGKERAVIYTDHKDELLAAASREDERLSATQLVQRSGVPSQRLHAVRRYDELTLTPRASGTGHGLGPGRDPGRSPRDPMEMTLDR